MGAERPQKTLSPDEPPEAARKREEWGNGLVYLIKSLALSSQWHQIKKAFKKSLKTFGDANKAVTFAPALEDM